MKKQSRIMMTLVIPLILVAVFSGTMLFFSYNTKARAADITSEVLRVLAREQRDKLELKLKSEFELLSVFSASIRSPEQMFSQETIQRMRDVADASEFETLLLANSAGSAISSAGERFSIDGDDFFLLALKSESALQKIENAPFGDGGPLFVLSVPIRPGERVLGMVIGVLAESTLLSLLNQNTYEDARTIICDWEGRVLAGDARFLLTNEDEGLFSLLSRASFPRPYTSESIISSIQSGAEGSAAYELEGERWLIAYTHAAYNNWVLYLYIPASTAEASLQSGEAEGYLLAGLSMASALLLTLMVVSLYRDAMRKSRKERERLITAEQEYRISAQQGGIMIIRFDIETGALLSCQGAIEHIPLPGDEAQFDSFGMLEDLVEEESREAFNSFWSSIRQGGANGQAEICMKNAQGQLRWFSFEFSAIGDGGGTNTQAIVTIRDITQQHERMTAYKRWQNLMAASIGKCAAVIEINLSTGDCERAEGEFLPFADSGGFPCRADVLMKRFETSMVEESERMRFHTFSSLGRIRDLAERGIQKDETEIHLVREDGATRLCLISAQMAFFPKTNESKAFVTIKDLDDSSLEMERLSGLALYDGLSGLLNRTAARSAIEEVLRFGGGERVALFMIDVDNFKMVNDTMGHQHGDLALKQISRAIKGVFRATDIIARIGGDEFFVFLSEVPAEDFAESKASALCCALRLTYADDAYGSVSLSASIGIVVAEREKADYEALYAEADRALYDAKRAGKDRYSIRYTSQTGASKTRQPLSAGYALQMQSLMKHLDGGVLLLEVDDTIEPLFISDGYFILQGIMREAIANGTFPEAVIHPQDFAQVSDAVRACAATGEPLQISYRNALAGGGYGWRHMNAMRVPSVREGKPVILAVISDITELHNATEHLESLAASSQIGIFIMRIGERFEITFFNDGALAITGFTYEQMRLFSRDASAFFRGENLQRFREEVRAATAENRLVDYLYVSQGFAGKRAHSIHLYGVRLDMQNGVPSFLILMVDCDKQA